MALILNQIFKNMKKRMESQMLLYVLRGSEVNQRNCCFFYVAEFQVHIYIQHEVMPGVVGLKHKCD